jgi:hypothetical protein
MSVLVCPLLALAALFSVLTIYGRCDLNTWCSCVRMLTRRGVRYYATWFNS